MTWQNFRIVALTLFAIVAVGPFLLSIVTSLLSKRRLSKLSEDSFTYQAVYKTDAGEVKPKGPMEVTPARRRTHKRFSGRGKPIDLKTVEGVVTALFFEGTSMKKRQEIGNRFYVSTSSVTKILKGKHPAQLKRDAQRAAEQEQQ